MHDFSKSQSLIVLNNHDFNTDQNNHDDGKLSVFCIVPFSSFRLLKALYVYLPKSDYMQIPAGFVFCFLFCFHFI